MDGNRRTRCSDAPASTQIAKESVRDSPATYDSPVNALRLSLLAAALCATAAGVAAPAAHADDAAYINALFTGGADTSDPPALIKAGKKACDDFRAGSIYVDVGQELVSENYTPRDSGRIIYAAALDLCPDQLSNVQAQVRALTH